MEGTMEGRGINLNLSALLLSYQGNVSLKNQINNYRASVHAAANGIKKGGPPEYYLRGLRGKLIQIINQIQAQDAQWYNDNSNCLLTICLHLSHLADVFQLEDSQAFNQLLALLHATNPVVVNNNDLIININLPPVANPPQAVNQLPAANPPQAINQPINNQQPYLRYVINELGDATYDNIMGLYNTIRHPIDTAANTVKGIYQLVTSPLQTGKNIAMFAQQRPWYFVFSIAEQALLAKAIGKGLGKLGEVTGITKKVNELTGKLADITKNANFLKSEIEKNAKLIESLTKQKDYNYNLHQMIYIRPDIKEYLEALEAFKKLEEAKRIALDRQLQLFSKLQQTAKNAEIINKQLTNLIGKIENIKHAKNLALGTTELELVGNIFDETSYKENEYKDLEFEVALNSITFSETDNANEEYNDSEFMALINSTNTSAEENENNEYKPNFYFT